MNDYPYLYKIMGAYFNQDYYLIADTIEELVADFIKTNSPENVVGLRTDIARFINNHKDNIEEYFEQCYGADFDPKLWDHTAESFLKQVDLFLSNM